MSRALVAQPIIRIVYTVPGTTGLLVYTESIGVFCFVLKNGHQEFLFETEKKL